jgi:hypothetical protein
VPEKITGTLALSILKSIYTLIPPVIFYKLYSVAIAGHLENHVYIIALTPDLQRVSFYSIIDFLYHSSTTELLLSPNSYKGS